MGLRQGLVSRGLILGLGLLFLPACEDRVEFFSEVLRDVSEFHQLSATDSTIQYQHAANDLEIHTQVTGTGPLEQYSGERRDHFYQVVGDHLRGKYTILLVRNPEDSTEVLVQMRLMIHDQLQGWVIQMNEQKDMTADFVKGDWESLARGEFVEIRLTASGQRQHASIVEKISRELLKQIRNDAQNRLPGGMKVGAIGVDSIETSERTIISGTRDHVRVQGPYTTIQMAFSVVESD